MSGCKLKTPRVFYNYLNWRSRALITAEIQMLCNTSTLLRSPLGSLPGTPMLRKTIVNVRKTMPHYRASFTELTAIRAVPKLWSILWLPVLFKRITPVSQSGFFKKCRESTRPYFKVTLIVILFMVIVHITRFVRGMRGRINSQVNKICAELLLFPKMSEI